MKICGNCKQEKSLDNYYKHNRKNRKPSYQSYCIPCSKSLKTLWSSKNYGMVKRSRIKNQYGLTEQDFVALYEAQDGKCPICENDLDTNLVSRKIHIDHCHKTGVIRGLLCRKCNLDLGIYEKLKNNTNVKSYLENFET